MATFTIRCGPSHQARRPGKNTIGAYVGTISTDGARTFVAKKKTQVVPVQGPSFVSASGPQGAWSNGRFRVSNTPMKTHPRHSRQTRQPQRKTVVVSVECRYCHGDHHINACGKLQEKNARRASEKRALKKAYAERKRELAEQRLAEQIRRLQEAKNVEVQESEDETDSDSSDDEEEEEIVTKPKRKVSFANDSDCLMKPTPTQVKEFNTEDPAITISSEEEDNSEDEAYFASKRSAGAWRPRSRSVSISEDPEVTALKKELAEKEKELAGMSNDSWADACDIDDLEEEIAEIKQKLGIQTEEEEEEPKRFQNMLTKIRISDRLIQMALA